MIHVKQELADLLFPNLPLTVEEIEAKYPPRDLKEGAMVTRFGPSPTGFMHVGGLYGSFIDSVLARQSDGAFFLRIEDTDSKREVEGATDLILGALDHFKIQPTEGFSYGGNYGPYRQSERKEIYQAYAKKLVSEGKAYPCFMSEEEISEIRQGQELRKEAIGIYGVYAVDRDLSLEEVKKHLDNKDSYVIRMKSPGDMHKEIILHDMIKGDITLPENILDEVILKKDGIPTYHFAHVVDDHLMRTTHVIRGDEWVPSFPKHLQLCQLLGFKPCKYAHHAPLTKKENGKIRKLSKRKDPEFSVSYYKEAGIPVDAVRLYLATLANTNFEEWYIQNKDKSIEDFTFTFKKMPTGGTLFDMEKLDNIARTYFSRLSAQTLYQDALAYYQEYDKAFATLMEQHKESVIAFLNIERNSKRPRKDIATYKDIKQESMYIFNELFYQGDPYKTIDTIEDTDLLLEYITVYDKNDSQDEWYKKIQLLAEKHGYAPSTKMYKENEELYKGHIGTICEAIRQVLTGRTQTPNLYELLQIIGIDEFKNRLQKYIETKNV
mgnify:FL=1